MEHTFVLTYELRFEKKTSMEFIRIKNKESKKHLWAVKVQGQLLPHTEMESAVLVQLYSAECLEICISVLPLLLGSIVVSLSDIFQDVQKKCYPSYM